MIRIWRWILKFLGHTRSDGLKMLLTQQVQRHPHVQVDVVFADRKVLSALLRRNVMVVAGFFKEKP